MARILIVHGISNQYAGEMELRAAWLPALRDGLLRAGCKTLPQEDDCFCPFYGDLFRPVGHLGGHSRLDGNSLDDVIDDEAELIRQIWESAAAVDDGVPRLGEFQNTLVRAPRFIERALTALAKSKFLAGTFPMHFFGDLRQVVLYLNNMEMRKEILGRVTARIGDETCAVIGHSLGSVVAYEAICAKPQRIALFISLGSPLGIRNIVFDKLTPKPRGPGGGEWPGRVTRWVNVSATGDIVAAEKALAPLFGKGVEDHLIHSGWDAHSSIRYLNNRAAGEAIASVLYSVEFGPTDR